METKIDKRIIVLVSIGLTVFASMVSSVCLINLSPGGDKLSEYNGLSFVFSAFLTFINSLTCLTALLCLRPKIRQNNFYYNLSLYGLLFVFNTFIIIVCFPHSDKYARTQEIIGLITPFIVFIIGQTMLGIILKKQE